MNQDIRVLAELIDTALTSDNPAVKDQLQKLLMTAALCSSENPMEKVHGVFSEMLKDMASMNAKIRDLEYEIRTKASMNEKYGVSSSNWHPAEVFKASDIDRMKRDLMRNIEKPYMTDDTFDDALQRIIGKEFK